MTDMSISREDFEMLTEILGRGITKHVTLHRHCGWETRPGHVGVSLEFELAVQEARASRLEAVRVAGRRLGEILRGLCAGIPAGGTSTVFELAWEPKTEVDVALAEVLGRAASACRVVEYFASTPGLLDVELRLCGQVVFSDLMAMDSRAGIFRESPRLPACDLRGCIRGLVEQIPLFMSV